MYGHLHGHGLTVLLSRIETPFLHTLHGLPIQTHPQGLRNTDVSRFPIGIHHKPERNRPPGTAVPALRLKTQGLEQTSPEEERLPFRCERAVRPRFSLQCLCLARIPKRLGRPPVLVRICRPCIDPYPSSQELPRRRTSNNPARCRRGDPGASRIFSRAAPALSRQCGTRAGLSFDSETARSLWFLVPGGLERECVAVVNQCQPIRVNRQSPIRNID